MTSGFLHSLFLSLLFLAFLSFPAFGPTPCMMRSVCICNLAVASISALLQLLGSFAVSQDRHRRMVASSCILASCICFACTRHSPIRAFPFSSLPSIWRTKHASRLHISTSFTRPQFIHDTFLFAVTRLTLHPNPTYCTSSTSMSLAFFPSIPPQACQAAMRPWREPVQVLCIYYIFLHSSNSATALEALPTPLSPMRRSLTLHPSTHTGFPADNPGFSTRSKSAEPFCFSIGSRSDRNRQRRNTVHALRKSKYALGAQYKTITFLSPRRWL